MTADTLDFSRRGVPNFQDQSLTIHNPGFGRWAALRRLALIAGRDIDLHGNVCLEGDAHANGGIIDADQFRCGTSRVLSYTSGFPLDLPAIHTEPDSFPGATYYHVTVSRGVRDTLLIRDRDWTPIASFVSPATPHPSLRWAYDRASKRLNLDVRPTSLFDQVTGLFPRLGEDSTVVVNFAGRDGTDHLLTDLVLSETGEFQIETTLINTRFTGSTCAERVDPSRWTGGRIETKTRALFAPRSGAAIIAHELWGNAQTLLGTDERPAAALLTGDVDLSVGQWIVNGTLVSLRNMFVGGGVTLTYNPRLEPILPPGSRPSRQSPLEIVSASLTGPASDRYSILGGFEPGIVAAEPLSFTVHFDSECVSGAETYRASLVFETRDAVTGAALPEITYHVAATKRGPPGLPPECLPPDLTRLIGSHPNPFASGCTIQFDLSDPGPVRLSIFDLQGRIVARLIDATLAAGGYAEPWDGRDDRNAPLASGLYVCRLQAGGVDERWSIMIRR